MNQRLPLEQLELVPKVSEDEENSACLRVAERLADELYDEIKRLWPDYTISPGIKLKPFEWLNRMLVFIVQGWPEDEMMRIQVVELLLRDDYIEGWRQGVFPTIPVKPWILLYPIPRIFEDIRVKFARLYRERERKDGEEYGEGYL